MTARKNAEAVETAEAVAPAAPVLDFEETEVPESTGTGAGRPAAPNPFIPAIERLLPTWDAEKNRTGKSLTVSLPADRVSPSRRQISEAAKAVGKSPRFTEKEGPEGTVRLTFWLIPQINRPRKTVPASPATEGTPEPGEAVSEAQAAPEAAPEADAATA